MSVTDFALVVGISRYPLLGNDLEGSVKDAENFKKWLIDGAQVPKENIQFVVSQEPPASGMRPVKEEIDEAFRIINEQARSLSSHTMEERRLYLYFAGHACTQESDNVVFLMANASLEELGHSLDMRSYHKGLVNRGIFTEQIFFYDCCRNYDRRVSGQKPVWTDNEPAPNAGIVSQFILFGTHFTEYAYEKEEYNTKRGLFTIALLEGLYGKAAQNVNGEWIVRTDSLSEYIFRRMEELAKEHGLRQNISRGGFMVQPSLILAKISEFPPVSVNIEIDEIYEGRLAIVYNSKREVVKRLVLEYPVTQVMLLPGFYQVVVDPDGTWQLIKVNADRSDRCQLRG